MKGFFGFFLCLTILFLSGSYPLAQETPGGESREVSSLFEPSSGGTPLAEISEPAYDLGTIALDRDYEHAFTVRNLGTADLEITKVTVG